MSLPLIATLVAAALTPRHSGAIAQRYGSPTREAPLHRGALVPEFDNATALFSRMSGSRVSKKTPPVLTPTTVLAPCGLSTRQTSPRGLPCLPSTLRWTSMSSSHLMPQESCFHSWFKVAQSQILIRIRCLCTTQIILNISPLGLHFARWIRTCFCNVSRAIRP